MTTIYFANTSTAIPELGNTPTTETSPGTINEILFQLNGRYPGLRPRLVDEDGRTRSSATLVKNVVVEDGYILIDKQISRPVRSLEEQIGEDDNLLVSLFDLNFIEDLLEEGLTPTSERFPYQNEEGRPNKSPYRGYVFQPERGRHLLEEPVRAFVNSPIEIGQLMFSLTDDADFMRFEFQPGDTTLDRFIRQNSCVIPGPLATAVYGLLTDPEEGETPELRLRLFQEDALFFMLGKLWQPESIPERALLLSMPTGGGKTEAFVFPLVSHLLARKAESLKTGSQAPHSVKALILYPTKALANDQAKRLAEIIHKVNAAIGNDENLAGASDELEITVGIFTGDTKNNRGDLRDPMGNFLSLFQVCPNCDQSDFDLESQPVNNKDVTVQRCKACGHRMTYTRVTRSDILNAPPDILITNPDTINYHIQIPSRQAIFLRDVEIVVFDEVHEYNGIFGCNVAHLLRRMEARREGKPPFYVGLSATIGNARNLAALLFNVSPDEVLYVRHTEDRPYLDTDKVARWRHHLLLTPNMYDSVQWLRAYPLTATINLASALGHAIRDPHFRKILIFSNFKADHDKLSFQIPENERDFVGTYRDDLRATLQAATNRGDLPLLTSSDRRVLRQVALWYEWESTNVTMHEPELTVGWHRGALEMEERVRAVNRFASLNKIYTGGEGRGFEYPTDVIVATKTLELGVDIGNVSIVMNSSSPFSNNDYVQRIGRGGRRKDSLAITIINPNNAIDAYTREHFSEFVFPETFEEVPIIASNELIMRAHILARILDYLASAVDEGWQITVGDWLNHELSNGGQIINVRDDPVRYAEALFTRIFPGNSFTAFQRWFQIEALALSSGTEGNTIEPYDLERDWVIDKVLRDACEHIKEKTSAGTREGWDQNTLLTGFDAVFPDLRPSLRGSGQSVGLYLKKNRGNDEWKDEISRDRAIYQNPPNSYQSQGRNLFIIERIRNEDQNTEEEVADLLVDNAPAYDHFLRHFPDSSLQAEPRRAYRWRLNTPADLLVRHYPGRYHCSNPRCGITYTAGEVTDDLRCLECNWKLHQVTRVYRCPQCSEIAEPPVPKLCINPDCVRHKLDRDQKGEINSKWNLRIAIKKAIKDRNPAPLRGFFRFKSRPNLEWECFDCHTIISLHDRRAVEPKTLPDDKSLDGPNAHLVVAWFGLYRPELPLIQKRAYLDLGFRLNGYECPDIDHCPAHWRGGLRAVNLPRFQTDVVQFHIAQKPLGQNRETQLGHIYFFKGDVISMAERYALSDPTEDENEASDVTRHRIFEEGELYATKFSPHMVGLRIRERLNNFLSRVPCMTTSCAECTEIEQIELHQIYRPQMALTPRFIEDDKPIQPDPRAVWCDVNRAGNCPSINCTGCEYFEWNALRRFAVLHTLLHGILWALPKYTGLDVGSFKGVVNPGFTVSHNFPQSIDAPKDLDLLIIDTNDGGSGAVHLVNRWWESHIVPMALEILQLAALPSTDARRANLNLPYTCPWFNGNLCPVLTGKFVAELLEGESRSGNFVPLSDL